MPHIYFVNENDIINKFRRLYFAARHFQISDLTMM
jgi:hypothetical protein